MSDPFEKSVVFTPAFDRRNADPTKNYGIHGVEARFVLKGLEGAVQFVLYTNWQLPHVREEAYTRLMKMPDRISAKVLVAPMPADLGYHSPQPMYEGHQPIEQSCAVLDGRPCYYDGSGLAAERIFDVLVTQGDEGLWRELTSYYETTFRSSHAK